jgi:UrcA family protein
LAKPKSEAELKSYQTIWLTEIVMNSHIKTRIPLTLASVMLLTCVWGASNAFTDEEVHSERVSFKDLNLDTPEGAEALYGRIHAAAKRVCNTTDPVLWSSEGPCVRKAEANAIGKVNRPQLSAYYKAKTGEHMQPIVVAGR